VKGIGISDMIESPDLFGPLMNGESWSRWRATLKAAFAEPLSDTELQLFQEVADRAPPRKQVKELDVVVGRGGGKDSAASIVAAAFAVSFNPEGRLRPGERAVVMIIAVDRRQARIAFGMVRGLFETIPALAAMVASPITGEAIELSNGVVIEVHTNSFRAVRGRSIICAIFDEVAFWRDENSASPDVEVYGAVRPGLARVPGSMLIMISSAHKRAGLIYERIRDHYGKDDDEILVVLGTTLQFNPSFDAEIIGKDLERDPQLYGAEYNSVWRYDLAGFLPRDILDAAVDRGVKVRPPSPKYQHQSFYDASGGSHDSSSGGIAHREGDAMVLDLLFEKRGKHNPAAAIAEFAEIAKSYRCRSVVGDKYAAGFVVDAFKANGVVYQHSALNRSEIYLAVLPMFSSGRVKLIDNDRMVSQFAMLERRTYSSGQDKIDHPRSGADDASNSAAGALWLASMRHQLVITDRMLEISARPNGRAFVGGFAGAGMQ
jgi:hypothetical protein